MQAQHYHLSASTVCLAPLTELQQLATCSAFINTVRIQLHESREHRREGLPDIREAAGMAGERRDASGGLAHQVGLLLQAHDGGQVGLEPDAIAD